MYNVQVDVTLINYYLLTISRFENTGVPNSPSNFRIIMLAPLPNYYPFT